MRYKVGDIVVLFATQLNYRVVATKDTPFLVNSATPVFPSEGMDYVIIEADVAGFSAFLHVMDEELE